ncbi:site-specific DNA-methyltransferase [bacterium]|nr:site-specific DNA-methyltransferase [bacterium]
MKRLYLGDNLPLMKMLLDDPAVRGMVRLIYTDPPFGTGQNFTVSDNQTATVSRAADGTVAYDDKLSGRAYLEFLRPRLELMRDLLADDGSIYLHIDCKVGHHVKVLMDDIFGGENFRNDITRIKCNPKNFKRYSYGNYKDMILFYSKGRKTVWNTPREPYTDEELRIRFPKVNQEGRRYTTTPLHAPGETLNGVSGGKWRGMDPPPGRHWRYTPDVLDEYDEEGRIERSSTGNPRLIIYADECREKGKVRQDIWEFKDPQKPVYPTEKNREMLRVIIEASSNPGDLVMDPFCGSGGTLVAAQGTGRRWIGVDDSEVAIDVALERLGSDLVKKEDNGGEILYEW